MKYVKLKDIAAISAGQRAPQGNDFCLEGNPFVKAGNLRELTEGKQIKDIQRVSDNVAKEYGLRLYPKGTILFAKSGMSCLKGYVYVLPEDAYVVSHLACITPYNEISDYLRYYFIYNRPNRLVKDISYPSISLSDIGNIRIDLKSKDERNEIVSLLDKTTCAISLLNKELQKLDYLTKARFVEMFGDLQSNPTGWKIEPFSAFAKIDANMTTDYQKYANYPHIGIDSIEKDTGRLIGYRTVKEDNVKSGKYIFTAEDIIYSKIRPNLNKVAMPDFDGLCSADAYPILPNKQNCNRTFLTYVMRSQFFLNYVIPLSARSNMPKVNREQIEGFSMPLPPLRLQNEFAAFTDQVDKSKTNFNPFNFLP